MADKRISQLIERVDIANNDVLPIVASGATTTNKVTISTIQDWMQENLDVGVTSVGITLGTSGTDVNVTGSPITTSGNITINIPDASATARGVVTTGTQTFAGYKIFTGTIGVNQDIQLATQGTALNTFIKNINATGLTSIGSNGFGFNNSNNIYFSGSSKGGGVFAFSNTGTQTYTLQDASGTLAFTSDLSGYVTLNTAQTITAQKTFTTSGSSDTMIISHGSGSGIALDVIKAGSGEAIRVTKTSGSGNAMTITGGLLSAEAATLTGALNGTSANFNDTLIASKSSAGASVTVANTGSNAQLQFSNSSHQAQIGIANLGSGAAANTFYINTSAGTIGSGITMNDSGAVTLAGALNGTSASFTGDLAVGTNSYTVPSGYTGVGINNATNGGLLDLLLNNVKKGELYITSTSFNMYGFAGVGLNLTVDNNASKGLSIATTGAATFSGALNGTSASFSGNVGIGTQSLTRTLNLDSSDIWISLKRTGNREYLIGSGNQDSFRIQDATAGFDRLTISSTGAATFSSSLTASSNIISGGFFQANQSGRDVYLNPSANFGSGDLPTIQVASNHALQFATNNQLRATISSSGNVGIGVTPSAWSGIVRGFQVGQGASFSANTATTDAYMTSNCYYDGSTWRYIKSGEFALSYDARGGTGDYVWQTAPSGTAGSAFTFTERMRITSGGYLKASNNGSYFASTNPYHEIRSNANDDWTAVISHSATSSPYGIKLLFSGASPANSSNYFIECSDTTTNRFRVASNGNVTNVNGSYGAISDIKLKENIEDATPKLDDLMKVKVRNYNLIGDDKKQIGVIAQELEEVFPAMIDESEDFEEVEVPQVDEEGNEVLNEEGEVVTENKRVSKGTTTKSVKYSVFVPMLIKAMQEQQEQIKSLTEQVEALKSQING